MIGNFPAVLNVTTSTELDLRRVDLELTASLPDYWSETFQDNTEDEKMIWPTQPRWPQIQSLQIISVDGLDRNYGLSSPRRLFDAMVDLEVTSWCNVDLNFDSSYSLKCDKTIN